MTKLFAAAALVLALGFSSGAMAQSIVGHAPDRTVIQNGQN